MMIYSRYLLALFFRFFLLFLSGFIASIVVFQLEKIAQFATFRLPVMKLIHFSLILIPYSLPTAIALASLLATLILSTRLSDSNELTALRAAGISLRQLLTPLITVHLLIACCTFYITSEIGTYTHRRERELIIQIKEINPLRMLENPLIAKSSGFFIKMDPMHTSADVKNVILAIPGSHLLLVLIDRFKIANGDVQGEKTTVITTLPQSAGFDHLVIENSQVTHAQSVEFATLLPTKGWSLAHDHLSWRLLIARENQLKKISDKASKRLLLKCKSEKGRRIARALLPLTFSLLGLASGLEIEGQRPKQHACLVLAPLTLISHFNGMMLDSNPLLALPLFFLPHLVIGGLFLLKLSRMN